LAVKGWNPSAAVLTGVEVQQRLTCASQFVDLRHQVVTSDVRDLHVAESELISLRPDRQRATFGIEPTRIRDDLDATLQASPEDLLHLLGERSRPTRSFARLQALTSEDQHRELREPIASQDIDRAVVNHLFRRSQAITEEATAVRDADRSFGVGHVRFSFMALSVNTRAVISRAVGPEVVIATSPGLDGHQRSRLNAPELRRPHPLRRR
jgi:hypothetical protein